MTAIPKVKRVRGAQLLRSVCVFALFFLSMLFIIFAMIAINDPSGWLEFIRENYSRMISLLVCTFLLYCIVYFYYYFEDAQFLTRTRNVALVFLIFDVAVILSFVFGKYISIYARPSAMLALLCLFLFNRRQAIMFNFVYSLLMFVIDTYTNNFVESGWMNAMYFSLMISFVCGTFSVFVGGAVKTRGGLLLTGTFISIPTVAIVLLLELSELAHLGWIQVVASAGFGILGCMCSAILTLALLPVFEVMFNRLTVFRLRELTRTDAKLLMQLKTEAPGTFNHSLIVAQLAEACALALGENSELARAAAYYHDVGKLKQPDCFTENQNGYNIHDELTPELSADIIRSHTKDGYDLLVANHMPELFADVAREHHGTLPIKYFYAKALKLTGGDADVKDYSYLGPTPRTKIAAIIMIADASEAAVRSSPDRSAENVEKIVRGIIEERMDLNQFDNCDITMRELTTIKQVIVAALSGVHHHRVEYPAIRFHRGGSVDEE